MSTGAYQGVVVGFILGYASYYLYKKFSIPVMSSHNHKFVMVLRTDIEKRKAAEYCSQAVLDCYRRALKMTPDNVKIWEQNGQPKVTLKLDENSNDNLLKLKQKAENLGIVSVAVKEDSKKNGEIYTVLGIGPASENLIDSVTGHLKLF